MKNYLPVILMLSFIEITTAQEQQASLAGKIYARDIYASNIARAIKEAIQTKRNEGGISLNDLVLGNTAVPPTVAFMVQASTGEENDPTKKAKEVAPTDTKTAASTSNHTSIEISSLENFNAVSIDSVYDMPEIPALFYGGKKEMNQFLGSNLKAPTKYEKPVKGKVFVRFMIEKSGQLSKIYLVKGLSDECNAEALRVIKQMPNWQPAMQNGLPVNSWQTLPINFILE